MIRFVLISCVVLLAQGCATITRGTSEPWTVESDPSGAVATLSSGESCKTPCTLEKKRKHGFTVTVAHEGFQPVTTEVVSRIAKAGAVGMAGNVILGGVIGIGVDAASGATKELRPNPLTLKLVPVDADARVEPAIELDAAEDMISSPGD